MNEGAPAPTPDLVRQEVQSVLTSPLFARAPRMRDLLIHLVEKKLAGQEAEIGERAIGLAVFRRDSRSYDTLLDPVVRVQVGRLRSRLADHYAAAEGRHAVRIAVPPGSYVPVISACPPSPAPARQARLALAPLRNLSAAQRGEAFVSGVDEELGARLFQAFGNRIELPATARGIWSAGANAGAAQRLEGSIRIEENHVRASMRVVDAAAGQIAWLSQVDCSGALGMQLQEELARAICDRLQGYLATN
nr:hypothetical protein [uncultured Massilia sp.]